MSYIKHTNLQSSHIVVTSCKACPNSRDLDKQNHLGISMARCGRGVHLVGNRKKFDTIDTEWRIPPGCPLERL